MRVFVHEYLSSGAAEDVGPSLRSEGWAMLAAVLDDFGRVPGVQTATLLDPLLASAIRSQPSNFIPHFTRPGAEEPHFRQLARWADFALIVAPEFDDLLAERCRWAEEEGSRLLGPSSAAVRLTADKLTLARHLHAHGIPTPPTFALAPSEPLAAASYPLVCKPRFGAGSQATFLIRNEEERAKCLLPSGAEGWQGELILQPYVPGCPVSVAFLAGPDRLIALPAAKQHLSADGRFHYRGGSLPLPEDLNRRAQRLAERAVRAVQGLHGYFGADLVLGDAADGSTDVVIEINPRLTTSYVGLRRLACFNLAAALLAAVAGAPLPSWRWRTEKVSFTAGGQVSD